MSAQKNDDRANELVRGAYRAQIARAMVELGLAEVMGTQPRSVADLSAELHADVGALGRLLRATSAIGLTEERASGHALTTLGAGLRSDAPDGVAGWLLLATAPWMVRAWEDLAHAVRFGEPTFPGVHGVGFWEYVATHPAEAGTFDAAMTSGAVARAADLIAAVDWSAVDVVIDVGGGQGLLAATVVGHAGQLRGVVADRAEVIALPVPEAVELGARLDMQACDFFADVPAGGDVYVLSRILHDWPHREALAILRRCRAAMGPRARLCILEQIAADPADTAAADLVDLAVKDLNMLVLVGGQERTLGEYTDLLAAADLRIESVHAGDACDVMQAIPASAS